MSAFTADDDPVNTGQISTGVQAHLPQWERLQVIPHTFGIPRHRVDVLRVLDGEIVCLDRDGKSRFSDLLHRRGQPRFVAFDLLHCDGQDLTYSPLIERKQRLRAILPKSQSVLFCDHIEEAGEKLFALACKRESRRHRREAQIRTLPTGSGAVVQDPQP